MRRRLLAVLVALALAVLGCLAVVTYVRAADERAVAGRQAVRVLVATKRIPAGTGTARVRAGGYVELVVMPAGTVPADALGELGAELDNLTVTADVQARQLLLRGMFGESERLTGGLAVPEGKIAVSVEMSAAGRVAGFVRPGSKVAVFDTFTMREGKGRIPAGDRLAFRHEGNQATRVLLPRVEVIAVGERGTAGAATAPAGGTSASGTGSGTASGTGSGTASASGAADISGKAKAGMNLLVTVAVTQAEAERLVHVAQTGTLYLALLDDTATIEPGPGVDNDTLFP